MNENETNGANEKSDQTGDDVDQSEMTPFVEENTRCQQDAGGEENVINRRDDRRGEEIQRTIEKDHLHDHTDRENQRTDEGQHR